MGYASNPKIAGPLEIDAEVLRRDALIREDNDGEVIDDNKVREFGTTRAKEIFAIQSRFFSALKAKLEEVV